MNIEGTEYSGDQDDVTEPVDRTSMNRRDFLRAVGRLSIAGLAHFTIIGALAKSAEAGCEEEDNCQCGADPGVQDKCTGNETPGQPERDRCDCAGDQGVADHCTCGGVGDSRASDSCYPGDPSSDACTCGDDWSGYDSCACGQDADGSTGSKDNCTCGGDAAGADSCTAVGEPCTNWVCMEPITDYHYDPGNGPADNCTCGSASDTAADTCKCWYDTAGDACDCSEDTGGIIDNCACCSDGAGADNCECGDDQSGSWCYQCDENPGDAPPSGQGYPEVADWCDGTSTTADTCTCSTNDGNTDPDEGQSNQADVCIYHANRPTDQPGGDQCSCGDDQANGVIATDFCRAQDGNGPGTADAKDVCTCDADNNNVADVCTVANPGETYDYCCAQDAAGDVV